VESPIDINDPSSFEEFETLLGRMGFERAMREVEKFDDRAALWIRLRMKDWRDKEIAQHMGFKHQQQLYGLKKQWQPVLVKIFEPYLRKAQ
jgi:hypothetical protein